MTHWQLSAENHRYCRAAQIARLSRQRLRFHCLRSWTCIVFEQGLMLGIHSKRQPGCWPQSFLGVDGGLAVRAHSCRKLLRGCMSEKNCGGAKTKARWLFARI